MFSLDKAKKIAKHKSDEKSFHNNQDKIFFEWQPVIQINLEIQDGRRND